MHFPVPPPGVRRQTEIMVVGVQEVERYIAPVTMGEVEGAVIPADADQMATAVAEVEGVAMTVGAEEEEIQGGEDGVEEVASTTKIKAVLLT